MRRIPIAFGVTPSNRRGPSNLGFACLVVKWVFSHHSFLFLPARQRQLSGLRTNLNTLA